MEWKTLKAIMHGAYWQMQLSRERMYHTKAGNGERTKNGLELAGSWEWMLGAAGLEVAEEVCGCVGVWVWVGEWGYQVEVAANTAADNDRYMRYIGSSLTKYPTTAP